MKSFGDMRVVPLGRVMCFILCILCSRSLCNSLSESLGLSCGSSVVACIFHSFSNSVICNWKFSFVLLRWMPPSCFRRNNVLAVGDLMQSCDLILGMFSAPPCLESMCCISPLYIMPSLPWSFRAFLSCSPMHLRYAFFNEKASSPNSSWGSWEITLAVHLGSPHIIFWIAMIFLSSFLMVGNENGSA